MTGEPNFEECVRARCRTLDLLREILPKLIIQDPLHLGRQRLHLGKFFDEHGGNYSVRFVAQSETRSERNICIGPSEVHRV